MKAAYFVGRVTYGTRALYGASRTSVIGLQAEQDIGTGAYEIRVRDEAGAFRVIYVAKFEDAVHVLHAFQKKTRATAKADARRYKLIAE